MKVIDCDWNKRNGNGHSTCHLCKTLTWDSFCYDFELKILDKELFNTVLCGDCISKIQNELKCRMVSNEEIIEEVEEDEFIDIESYIGNVGRVDESNIEEYIHILFNQQSTLIQNQKKIINEIKNKD